MGSPPVACVPCHPQILDIIFNKKRYERRRQDGLCLLPQRGEVGRGVPSDRSLDVWCCGFVRQRDDMEMHAGVHTEIHRPVTDQIEHRKGILGVGVGIQVEPYGVFPPFASS